MGRTESNLIIRDSVSIKAPVCSISRDRPLGKLRQAAELLFSLIECISSQCLFHEQLEIEA